MAVGEDVVYESRTADCSNLLPFICKNGIVPTMAECTEGDIKPYIGNISTALYIGECE